MKKNTSKEKNAGRVHVEALIEGAFVAVIRNWARREAEKKKTENTALSSFETEDVLTAAMARTYGG